MADSAQNSQPPAEGVLSSEQHPLASLSEQELILRYFLFSSMNFGMANRAVAVMEKVKEKFPRTEKLFSYAFRKTAGKVFFGGETLEEAKDKCGSLLQHGTGVIIDYAAPENGHGLPEKHYTEEVPARLRDTIKACAKLKDEFPRSTASLAIKISTLADYDFLKSVSGKLKQHAPLGEDREAYEALRGRFEKLVKDANAANIKPFIDAEKTEINALIRDLCYGAADKDMKLSMTLQCYLKETPDIITGLLARDRKPDIKLVRGAYMGKGYEDELPYIWDNGGPKGKKQTDNRYDESFERLYGHVDEITAATHNQQSLRKIAGLVSTQKSHTKVNSATLLGMGDGLKTDPGMEKLKYVPYGEEMHYFMRRGTEFAMNPVTDDNGQKTTRGRSELELVRREMKMRAEKLPGINEIMTMIERDQGRALAG
jgi:hypothetical protein